MFAFDDYRDALPTTAAGWARLLIERIHRGDPIHRPDELVEVTVTLTEAEYVALEGFEPSAEELPLAS